MPSSTVTNGIGGAWEYRRGGYSAVVERRLVRRAPGWREWGVPGQTADDLAADAT